MRRKDIALGLLLGGSVAALGGTFIEPDVAHACKACNLRKTSCKDAVERQGQESCDDSLGPCTLSGDPCGSATC